MSGHIGALVEAVAPDQFTLGKNPGLFRLGCGLRGRGTEHGVILEVLREVNQVHLSGRVGDLEVQRVARSCSRYPANAHAAPAPRSRVDAWRLPWWAEVALRVIPVGTPGRRAARSYLALLVAMIDDSRPLILGRRQIVRMLTEAATRGDPVEAISERSVSNARATLCRVGLMTVEPVKGQGSAHILNLPQTVDPEGPNGLAHSTTAPDQRGDAMPEAEQAQRRAASSEAFIGYLRHVPRGSDQKKSTSPPAWLIPDPRRRVIDAHLEAARLLGAMGRRQRRADPRLGQVRDILTAVGWHDAAVEALEAQLRLPRRPFADLWRGPHGVAHALRRSCNGRDPVGLYVWLARSVCPEVRRKVRCRPLKAVPPQTQPHRADLGAKVAELVAGLAGARPEAAPAGWRTMGPFETETRRRAEIARAQQVWAQSKGGATCDT